MEFQDLKGDAALLGRLAVAGAYRAHWARLWLTAGQIRALAFIIVGILALSTLWPLSVIGLVIAVLGVFQLINVLFRMLLWLIGFKDDAVPRLHTADAQLPVYTIIVPMFDEAAVVPDLVAALRRLDYPPDRLDVIVALESADQSTRAAFAALDRPNWIRIVIVPDGAPRTKPRACNVALAHARGSFVVVYDAEDRPEPRQLKDAVAAFDAYGPAVGCLQAKLIPYNAHTNFITRMFALDYCQWFDATLMGLQRLRLPIPLGGTSNHFRAAVLNDSGAWDPYNMTEDADLGLRIARLGYETRILNSTTFEEAPVTWRDWRRQRARWVHGYVQTLLVHFRSAADLGLPRMTVRHQAGVILFILGAIVFALANPLLWLLALFMVLAPGVDLGIPTADPVATIAFAGLVGGNGLLAAMAVAAPLKRGMWGLAPWGLAAPVFWIMVSIAAYRGVWQFLRTPFHWNKTPHGVDPAARPANRLAWRVAGLSAAAIVMTAEAEAGAWAQADSYGLAINQAGIAYGNEQRLVFDGYGEVGLGNDLTAVFMFDGDALLDSGQYVSRAGAGLRYSFDMDWTPSWTYGVEPTLRYQWHQSVIPDPVFAGDGFGYGLRLDAGRSFEIWDYRAFTNVGVAYVGRSLAPPEYKLEIVVGVDLADDWQAGIGYFGSLSPGRFYEPGAYAKDEVQAYLRHRIDVDYSVSVSVAQTVATWRTDMETSVRIALWTHFYPEPEEE